MSDEEKFLTFLHEAEKLKTVLRHSWLSSGRRESVAEHSWRMALMAMLFHNYLGKEVNLLKTLKMILVHDLGEIHATDFWAFNKQPTNKTALERRGLKKLTKPLPTKLRKEIINLWEEFEAGETTEARFAKFLDKHEVLLQHDEADVKYLHRKEIPFNLQHGKQWLGDDKFLIQIRKLIDEETIKVYKRNKIDKKLYEEYTP